MNDRPLLVSVLITESHLHRGKVFKVASSFITEVRDIQAGVYREVELATGELGIAFVTEELMAEFIRLGISD